MSQLIKFKRGLKADLPASANAGEPLFTTDTNELFVGTGSGIVPIVGVDENVKVGATGTKDFLSESYFEQDSTNHIRIKQSTLLTGVNADQVDSKNVDDAGTSTDYLWTAGKVISYVQQFANGLDWQNSVLSIASVNPVTPVTGARYLIAVGATGAFAGKDNQIAEWNGVAYVFTAPNPGFATYVEDVSKQYTYNGTSWVSFGSTTNHNATSGLQGGTTNEYYHLTSAQYTGLTSGAATTLHTHNTDNLTEGSTNVFFTAARAQDAVGGALVDTNSIDFTYAGSQITADLRIQTTDTIALAIDASGVKADLKKQNTDSISLSSDASGVKADLNKQNTNSITLGIDASGLKADLNTQNSDTIALSVDASGLKATINKQNSDSVTLSSDASGLKAVVNVDDSTIKIDPTNHYLYVNMTDGGTF
jgi:hypothetical protein